MPLLATLSQSKYASWADRVALVVRTQEEQDGADKIVKVDLMPNNEHNGFAKLLLNDNDPSSGVPRLPGQR